MIKKELMPWAQELEFEFWDVFRDSGCSCHISPPCNFCSHPGNPRNLSETDDAWGYPSEVMLAEASTAISAFVHELFMRNLQEMREDFTRAAVRADNRTHQAAILAMRRQGRVWAVKPFRYRRTE